MLPIILNPAKVTVVIFGYGGASKIKVQGIARSGITCHVISSMLEETLSTENITFEKADYDTKYLQKGQVVIAATDCEKLNERIAKEARACGKLVLNLSNGAESDFHMMSWRKKGSVTLGLSTGSCAPKESRRLIESLMETIDDETVDRIHLLGALRNKLKVLNYKPLKPIVNQLVDESIDELERLNELTLEELDEIIKKFKVC